jgi:hypothetical protein
MLSNVVSCTLDFRGEGASKSILDAMFK